MKKHLVISLLLVVISALPRPATAGTIDFEKISNQPDESTLPNLTARREKLWSGRTDSLILETGSLGGELLIVTATSSRIRVKTGQNLDLLEGSAGKRIPGRILYMDLHSVPSHHNMALITLTHLSKQTLKSTVFSVRDSGPDGLKLNSFFESDWSLIRPVDRSIYRQQFDPQSQWVDSIEQLVTTSSGYRIGSAITLPAGARLSSLLKLNQEKWIYLDSKGHLILNSNQKIKTKISGNFGATSHRIRPKQAGWGQQQPEPLRLPPVNLSHRGIIGVPYNTETSGGLMGWFYERSTTSSIELFELTDDRLDFLGSIGPFDKPILDVEVPPANPNQLLWLRKKDKKKVVLEMIDFNEVESKNKPDTTPGGPLPEPSSPGDTGN